jgi:hypothetical protein
MLNLNQYTTFRAGFNAQHGALPHAPTHADYVNYEHLWENYIHHSAAILNGIAPPTQIGLIAMESAPGNAIHPHPNYIFNNTARPIGRGDSYLRNIYNGALMGPGHHHGISIQNALDNLLTMNDNLGNHRPIVLFDLLPTHGITLSTPARQLLRNGVLAEVQIEIGNKLNFLYINILQPLGLGWNNVHLKFACPPTTVHLPSLIPGFIAALAPGITIHPVSLNNGPNTVPVPANLTNNILHHGF